MQPPSQDSPKSPAERRREARAKLKWPSKRKRGGEPGHEDKPRLMAPLDRVDHRSEHLPEAYACVQRFDGATSRWAIRSRIRPERSRRSAHWCSSTT